MKRYAAALALVAGLVSPLALAPGCAFPSLRVGACGNFEEAMPSCQACVVASCCSEAEACRASAPCSALFDCITACGSDAACLTACGKAHPSDAAAAALSACRMEICQDDCMSCGGYFHVDSPTCDDCTRTNCCAQAVDCFEDPDCSAYSHCTNNCNHPRCNALCGHLYPEGRGKIQPHGHCLHVACRTACELGRRFECAGNFDWPEPVASELTYTTTLFRITDDAGVGEPLAGATFRACSRVDPNCEAPIDETTLDDEGRGSVVVPGGFDAYFETSGLDDVHGNLRFNGASMLTHEDWWFGLYTRSQVETAFALLALDELPDRGLLLVYPKDCDEVEAPGIRLELDGAEKDDAVVRFYFQDGFPNPQLTETNPGNNQGGGFANVPAGLATVRAIQVSTGREVATEQVLIRAGWNTVVHLLPSP